MSRRLQLWLGALLWLGAGAGVAVWAQAQAPAWLGALAAGGVELAHPERLWGLLACWAVPLLALGALGDLPRWQAAAGAVGRMLALAALVLAATEPRSRQETPRGVTVVHLVDRSESMPAAALARAATAISDDIVAHREESGDSAAQVHVIAFDGGARRLPWPPTATAAEEPLPPLQIDRDPAGKDASDLEAALDLALGQLDPTRAAHVVVWSDGAETRGDVRRLAGLMRRAGAQVHRGDLGTLEQPAEVLVESVQVPERVRANLPFPVKLRVRSTAPAKVRCEARGEGVELKPEAVAITAGVATIELGEARFRKAGAHELATRCAVVQGQDRFDSNNAMRVRVVVAARPRVLLVDGSPTTARTLARALEDDFELTLRGPDGLPRDLSGLLGYDAVIVSDLARVSEAGVPQVGDAEQKALGAFVEQGGGLMLIGGEDALGSGGWQGSWLEKHVLPVRLEIESTIEQPTIAMMLVLDRSGSMAGAKMELAKEAARATADALGHEDRIGVIAFDNAPRRVVSLQRAGNRYRIATGIGGISATGGTHIYPALQLASTELERVRAKVKHVILLSDGQAPRMGIDALVRQMRRSGITVTTVGVGEEVDRSLLESIADRGGGRSYFTDRPETLPRIFVRETKEIAGETVVEKRVRPRLAPSVGRIELLRGFDIGRAPVLRGFLTAKVKRGAEEILRVTSGEPLLVRWRRGLGKVSVWTSDLKARWAQDWIDWSGYAVLARQLVRDLQREDLAGEVQVRLAREDERLRIAVDAIVDDAPVGKLLAEATVRTPEGDPREIRLTEVALGRYEAAVPMRAFGPYDVEVRLRADAERPVMLRGRATAVRPYPDELRIAAAGKVGLDDLVAETGGVAAAGPEQWRDRGSITTRSWQPLWQTLVLAAIALLLFDLLLRRVRLGRARPTSWFAVRR
ncbi:MAG: VWA domain-containing protein [Deltaproteobacteria bacterium]|nr:VWA domain-containing protein [Deltaproteobacteria bacterium]